MSTDQGNKAHWIDSAAHALVCLYFFLMPWGVYTVLPIDNLCFSENYPVLFMGLGALTGVCFALFIPLAVLCVVLKRRWPVPVELTWPLVLMFVLSLTPHLPWAGLDGSEWIQIEFAFAFAAGWPTLAVLLCVPHWRTVRDALFLLAFSGACVAVLCVLAYLRVVIPTSFTTHNTIVLAGAPYTTVFLIAALAAAVVACARVSPLWMRLTASLLAAMNLALFCFYLTRTSWIFPLNQSNFAFDFVVLALMFWFIARVAAKGWLRWKELAQGSSTAEKRHRSMLLAAVALLLVLFLMEQFGMNLLTGSSIATLLAAYIMLADRPEGIAAPRPRIYPLAILVLASALLLVFNVTHVSPNLLDARNYVALARWSGNSYMLRDTYRAINQLYPGERNTYYWIARARLEAGDAAGSVDYYLKSLEPGAPVIIKEYPAELKEEYLAELRGAASTLEQDTPGLPYERVLLATGQADAAMSLLMLKAEKFADAPQCPREIMLQALGTILRRADTSEIFATWPDDLLYGLLRQQAVLEMPAPDGVPGVLSLTLSEERVEFELTRGGAVTGGSFVWPESASIKRKAVRALTAAEIVVTPRAVETPLFGIALDPVPRLELKDAVQGGIREGIPLPTPFTRQLVLVMY